VKLKCPACGWEYDPADYPAALSPEKFVPHHEQGKSWCFGTEQSPAAVPPLAAAES